MENRRIFAIRCHSVDWSTVSCHEDYGLGCWGDWFDDRRLIAGREPGCDVTLVGRGEHGSVMQKRGTLLFDDGRHSREIAVKCTSDVSAAADSQILLLTVKSQDTDAMMQVVGPYVGDAILVSLQNGMNDVALRRTCRMTVW